MAVLNISELKPGMKLASEVRNIKGQLLLPGGIELEEKHIKLFKAWNIIEADIEGAEKEKVDYLGQIDEQDRAMVEEQLKKKFPYRIDDAVNEELKRLATRELIERLVQAKRKAG